MKLTNNYEYVCERACQKENVTSPSQLFDINSSSISLVTTAIGIGGIRWLSFASVALLIVWISAVRFAGRSSCDPDRTREPEINLQW